ncbi:MAG: GAF domain-containing protein, partial [Bryobacterales bacterium]|nr:GAF domain-containing protein [Bryobacterales bacterium]
AATTTGDFAELLEWVAKRLREGGSPAELTLWRVQPNALKATRVATTAAFDEGAPDREMDEQVVRIWRDMSELGTALILGDAQRGPLRKVLAPSDDIGTGIVVPVPDDGALLCALVVWRRVGTWTEADRALVEELAGPMATALRLHNERHEAMRAREALEADRRALLQRLDRDDLGDA